MKKLLVFCLIAGIIQATVLAAFAAELSIDIIVENEIINYNDPAHPLIINIPAVPSAGSNTYGYVAVSNGSILPFSIYRNSEVIFITPRTGTFGVVNNASVFTDTAGHWAENNIIFASARELFSGVGNDLFAPNAPMTRAMFVQVLANIENADLTAYTVSRFTDVSTNAWYMSAIEWAAETGLASGVGDGLFDPSANITREQMARMLVNYIEYRQFTLPLNNASTFNDESSVSAWALDPVRTLHQAGVVGGRAGNIFDPQGIATRAEAATVFMQFITALFN